MTHTQTKTNCLTPNQQVDFLRGQLTSAEEVNAQSHLDECAACRRQLENTAATKDAWQEAQRFISSDALELDDDSAGDHVGRDSLQIQQVIDSLNPTDDPQSLGRLGTYEVTGVVGSGGMGVVLKAQERSLDRVVAIKVMAPHLAGSGAARKRFAREAKAAAAVIHPNVMAIHSVSNNGPLPYLVMPYVGGESLQKRLDHSGQLPVVEVLRVGSQIAAGLAAAHGQGLVHRDIKPANILLDDGVERVSLTDFGLARAVDDASMTRTGVIAGTPQFMSPEQARGESIDHRSDLFSLGSVLYSMCTGHAPFRAETSYGVLRRITDDEPRSIREINSDVPQWLEAFVMKLLSKSANDRFESTQQVANLLEECVAHVQQPTAVALPAVVGKLKAYAAPSTSSRKSDAGSSRPQSRHRKLIALAIALPLFVVGAALAVFELNKGTLRIETNSEREVAIRITQGDNVVEELTVTKAGESIRLAAGKYVIEVGGDANEFQLEGDQVTLSRRGDWLARVTYIEDKAPSTANAVNPETASGNTGPIVPDSTGVVSAPTVGNVKSSLDCRTLEEMTACYNEQTRELRAELFKDDIPDLTVEQMREAMLDSAKTSRQDARFISLAVALEESAKSGRLSDKLEFIGMMGGEGPDHRQIAPGLHYITGPRHRRLTTLPKAELIFRRNGPSSTAWGDIKVPFDGLWELESVSQSGSEFAESGVTRWTKENPVWRRIRISQNSLRLTGALHEYRFELKGNYASRRFVLDKDETLFEGLATRQHFGEEATLSLAIDLTGKTKVKTFKTEGTPTTVLRFRHVEDPEDNPSISEEPSVAIEPNKALGIAVQSTIETFLAAALAGEVTTARKLAPAIPSEQIKAFAQSSETKRIHIDTVHVDAATSPKVAIVITKAVRLTAKQKQPDGQRDGFLVLSLTGSKTGWHITDIDFEDEEGLEDELARFLTEHPAAVLLPKTPTPAMLKTLEDGHDAEAELSAQPSPKTPQVTVTVVDVDGLPAQGAKVKLVKFGENHIEINASDTSDESGIAIDRRLPFGTYKLSIVTKENWVAMPSNVQVEFDKPLNLKIAVPRQNEFASIELHRNRKPNEEALADLRFGVLEDHSKPGGSWASNYSPEPNESAERHEVFPTLQVGISKIYFGLKLVIHQTTKQPDGGVFKWETDSLSEHQSLHFLVGVGGDILRVQTQDHRHGVPEPGGDFADIEPDYNTELRIGYEKFGLWPKADVPGRVRIPAGRVSVYVTGVYGLPDDSNDQKGAPLKSLGLKPSKNASEIILMEAHLRNDSKWLPRLLDLSNWQTAAERKERLVYFPNLLRRTHDLKADESLQIALEIPEAENSN